MFSHNVKRRMQRGFTLIELVIVIVIIGILAAIALPKFAALSAEARAGVIKGVAGSLASANVAIFASAQANNVGAAGPLPAAKGGCTADVPLTNFYAADIVGLRTCVSLTPAADFTTVGTTEIQHAGATTPGSCKVTYVAAASLTVPPTYTTTVTGC